MFFHVLSFMFADCISPTHKMHAYSRRSTLQFNLKIHPLENVSLSLCVYVQNIQMSMQLLHVVKKMRSEKHVKHEGIHYYSYVV